MDTNLHDAIRQARGIRTRREFSDIIGATEATIYKWESGTTAPQLRPYINALVKAGVPRRLLVAARRRPDAGTGPA